MKLRLSIARVLCASFMLLALSRAFAETTFSSGPRWVALVELYTSEGCSSCPPADRWLGALRDHPGLWRDFVPVEFHVNYWDRLGWKDVYASKLNTERQYAYANAWSAGSVYTPCFVRDGKEWHAEGEIGHAGDPATGNPGVLTVTWREGGQCDVTFKPGQAEHGALVAEVALLGSGLRSDVKAGENAGRNLPHDFVVLGTTQGSLQRRTDGSLGATLQLSVKPAGRLALAAWVAPEHELAPIQATGGWLAPDKKIN